MHLKTFLLLTLVLLSAIGTGCTGPTSSGSNTGTGGDASLYGTWNLVSSSGGVYPQRITLNSNGTGTYAGGIDSNINWSQSGSQVAITTGASQAAYINNLTYPVGNTFTLSASSGSGVYTRG
ncbi:MAG: hypothetical protein C0407_12195 [Desulfobacca sp.]|nr:hypothetical protein [Desulfobacca sp.]